jgi:5-methylcytosine-specific restriction endonuclease McrA
LLPEQIPILAEKIASLLTQKPDNDYFGDKNNRRELFERDKWICQYCGDKVNEQSATLDHFIPQSKGGGNNKENLKTCCLECNGIKAGKAYEEIALLLLKSIQERRARSNE